MADFMVKGVTMQFLMQLNDKSLLTYKSEDYKLCRLLNVQKDSHKGVQLNFDNTSKWQMVEREIHICTRRKTRSSWQKLKNERLNQGTTVNKYGGKYTVVL